MTSKINSLRPARLHVGEGEPLDLRAAEWDGRLFLECEDARRFMERILPDVSDFTPTDNSLDGGWLGGVVVRGVIVPGEGGFFELCGSHGLGNTALGRLNDEEVHSRIIDRLIWQVR